MSSISYKYTTPLSNGTRRPIAAAVAFNIRNGREAPVFGILDTGADQTTLTVDLLRALDIDPDDLEDFPVVGVHGGGLVKKCDFIAIGLIGPENSIHFPNGRDPIPLHFAEKTPDCLLGMDSFLNRCSVLFDGPRQIVTVKF